MGRWAASPRSRGCSLTLSYKRADQPSRVCAGSECGFWPGFFFVWRKCGAGVCILCEVLTSKGVATQQLWVAGHICVKVL